MYIFITVRISTQFYRPLLLKNVEILTISVPYSTKNRYHFYETWVSDSVVVFWYVRQCRAMGR